MVDLKRGRWLVIGVACLLAKPVSAQLASQPGPAVARELEAAGPAGPLRGTLLMPGGKAPVAVVLIVPGSGPTDRDGNNALGVKGSVYKQLAEGLGARGIATVRIDKRGQFGSASAIANPNDVTIGAYADDVLSWVQAIRRQTGARCVWVLGHSEGGLVALKAAEKPAEICGLVLLSASGRRLSTVIRAQIAANPANAPVSAQANAALDSLEAGKTVDTAAMHPALNSLFNAQVQPYLIDLFRYDPAAMAGRYHGPALIVQGARDVQIGTVDAELLAKAQPAATIAILPGVNHVLKPVASDDRAANIATYGDAALPIAPVVATTIADFITAKSKR